MACGKLGVFVIMILSLFGQSFCEQGRARPIDYSNWMRDLSDQYRSRPITRIAIPGSHDSCTSNLDPNSEIGDASDLKWVNGFAGASRMAAPVFDLVSLIVDAAKQNTTIFTNGAENRLNNNSRSTQQRSNQQNSTERQSQVLISSALSSLGSSSSQISYNWAKTQDLDVEQQLAMGIRYFDIRLGYQQSTDRIRIVHGIYGRTFATEMIPIAAFARSHPSEVIILYFRHVYNFNRGVYEQLRDRVKLIFTDTLLAYQTENNQTRSLEDISLDWLESQSPRIGNVIIIFDITPYVPANQFNRRPPTFFWPPGASILTLWAGTSNWLGVQSFLDQGIRRISTPVDDRMSYFLEFQGVGTGDASDISGSLFAGTGTLKGDVALGMRDNFIRWLKSKKADVSLAPGTINVCIVDFISKQYVDAVLAFNNSEDNA